MKKNFIFAILILSLVACSKLSQDQSEYPSRQEPHLSDADYYYEGLTIYIQPSLEQALARGIPESEYLAAVRSVERLNAAIEEFASNRPKTRAEPLPLIDGMGTLDVYLHYDWNQSLTSQSSDFSNPVTPTPGYNYAAAFEFYSDDKGIHSTAWTWGSNSHSFGTFQDTIAPIEFFPDIHPNTPITVNYSLIRKSYVIDRDIHGTCLWVIISYL